jgi:hypothetical protein
MPWQDQREVREPRMAAAAMKPGPPPLRPLFIPAFWGAELPQNADTLPPPHVCIRIPTTHCFSRSFS